MANDVLNTPESIALALSGVVMPLSNALTSAETLQNFIEELGWTVPDSLDSLGIDASKFDTVLQKLEIVLDINFETESNTNILAKFADLLAAVIPLFVQIYQVGSTLDTKLDTAFKTATGIVNQIPVRLVDYLLHQFFCSHYPPLYRALIVFGIFEIKSFEEDAASFTSNHKRRIIYYDRLLKLLTKPDELFGEVYGWGTPAANLNLLLENLYHLAIVLNLPARLEYPVFEKDVNLSSPAIVPDEGEADRYELRFPIFSEYNDIATVELGTTLMIVPPVNAGEAPGLALCPYVEGALEAEILLDKSGRWVLTVKSELDLVAGVGLILRPAQSLKLLTDIFGTGTQLNGDISLEIKRQSLEDEKIKIFSIADLVELSIKEIAVGSGIQVSSNKPEIKVEIALNGGNLKIGTGDADGFQKSLLPADLLNVDFDITLGWSSVNGIYFKGSSALEINIPTHIQLGPIDIQGLTILIQPKDSKITLGLATDIKAQLGPITVVVQKIGANGIFSFPQGGGNMGPLQLDVGFRPPNGVGLSIDAGIVKGGGFLFFDFDKGEYAGALELSVQNTIQVAAVGIINTKFPDGTQGFSLLIIIAVQFTPGIALGMGFFLSGLGGLLGINRTINVPALRDGVKNNAIEHIMFPEDVVANINTLLPQIKLIFPIQRDQFMIGLMARIKGEDFIVSFGVEDSTEFQQIRRLKVNDRIIIRSHHVSHAPKYAYPIIAGEYVERDKKVIYKRGPRKNGC